MFMLGHNQSVANMNTRARASIHTSDWPGKNLAIRPEQRESNWKKQREMNQKAKISTRKMGTSRNSWRVKVGGVGVEAMITLHKLEHLCETGGQDMLQDSMYSFAGATTRFGGASACYRPLRPHFHFWGGVLHMEAPRRSQASLNIRSIYIRKTPHIIILSFQIRCLGRELECGYAVMYS